MSQPCIEHYSLLHIHGLPLWASWLLVISWFTTMITTLGFLTLIYWRLR